jgi:hypothetical protein
MADEEDAIVVRGIRDDEARVNVTWGGQNGDLPDPVHVDSADGDVKQMLAEASRGGGIPGIAADRNVDLGDFVVDRFAAKDDLPNRISVRPKTPFGVRCQPCGLNADHADLAECMRDLMNYIEPDIRATHKFQRVLQAGYDAMKAELAK